MNIGTAIEILKEHNKWRRGEPPYDYGESIGLPGYTTSELGVAIDTIISKLEGENEL